MQESPLPDLDDVPEGHPRRQLILAVMCLCLVLIIASVSSLNVAIPTIVRELAPTSTQQLWILDSYALVFAGLLLFAGALGDRYGRKPALLVGLAIFGGASTAAAWSNSPEQVIAFRSVMGVGAALIMPATLSTIAVVFPPAERAKAIAVWAGFAGAGGAIGPLMSGLLLERFWWGSVFFIATPIVVLASIAIAAVVPNSRDTRRRPLDFVGALLSVIGLTGIVFGIIEGPENGWTAPLTIGGFVLGTLGLVGFVLWELRRSEPMLDPRLFLIPRFGLGSLTITAAFLSMFGMFFLMTLYLQFVVGYTALGAAVRLLPFSAVMIALAPRSPQLTAKFGTRRVVSAGFIIQATGFAVAQFLEPDSSYLVVVAAVVLMGSGMALLMPPTTNAIVTSLPPDKAGVASAVNDTTREVGGAVGIALMGTLMTSAYQSSLGSATDSLPPELAEVAKDSIGGAAQVASILGGPEAAGLLEKANEAYVSGMHVAFWVAVATGLILAAVIGRFYPTDEQAHTTH
ncbi:MAG: DHA2 family efflux MFS transporter permease subunit [Actinomycetia bacterium]|nr:DHA2 family efflux MFS transporter permease subunit [Actinomycetes bacterium]